MNEFNFNEMSTTELEKLIDAMCAEYMSRKIKAKENAFNEFLTAWRKAKEAGITIRYEDASKNEYAILRFEDAFEYE